MRSVLGQDVTVRHPEIRTGINVGVVHTSLVKKGCVFFLVLFILLFFYFLYLYSILAILLFSLICLFLLFINPRLIRANLDKL